MTDTDAPQAEIAGNIAMPVRRKGRKRRFALRLSLLLLIAPLVFALIGGLSTGSRRRRPRY